MGTLMENVKHTNLSSGQVALWWIGQAGYIIKTSEDKVVFIDAFLSEELPRMISPPLNPNEVECDLYLCTHNHCDHTDLRSISRIRKKEEMTFIGPKNVMRSLSTLGIRKDRLCEVNVGDFVRLSGVEVWGTFCIPTDDTVLDSIGFLLRTEGGITFYHSGDTGFHDFLFYLNKYSVDVMLVCINGGMGNMDVDEAVRLTRYLRPKVVIPNHYGMFADNTANPISFKTRLFSTGAEPICIILKIGEKYLYTQQED